MTAFVFLPVLIIIIVTFVVAIITLRLYVRISNYCNPDGWAGVVAGLKQGWG